MKTLRITTTIFCLLFLCNHLMAIQGAKITTKAKGSNKVLSRVIVGLMQEGKMIASKLTDDKGIAEFTELAEGKYKLTAMRPDYSLNKEITIHVGKNILTEVTVLLDEIIMPEIPNEEEIEEPIEHIAEEVEEVMDEVLYYDSPADAIPPAYPDKLVNRLEAEPSVELEKRMEVLRNESSVTPESTNEEYGAFVENEYKAVQDEPLSTFSIDVDRASYANIRRYINNMQQPPKNAIRIEEMVNYFDYNYPQPTDEHPFSVTTEASDCPWNKEAKLVHIGLQGKHIDLSKAPASNLVFLLDVSGSMNSANKLGLLKESLKLLVNNMRADDKVSIVVYAGAAGLVLPSTNDKNKIIEALDKLEAGGSTAGGAGIQLAYKIAKNEFIKGGNNRVILATDGDFNVGVSSTGDLENLIVEKRNDDIYLTVLGFGTGNYKDAQMEVLADKGNGNYAYIDNIKEAKKTLVNEMGGTLYTIAKDVKIQVEFNPAEVASYRLVGYENRLLNKEDFNDDTKDAGELGAGHTVTALYEIVLTKNYKNGKTAKQVDKLKYQKTTATTAAKQSDELLTIKLRYKTPTGTKSTLLEQPLENALKPIAETSENYRFSAAVAGFGMLLRDSKFKNNLTYKTVQELAEGSKGADKEGYRAEFIGMVKNVNSMTTHAGK